MVINQLN